MPRKRVWLFVVEGETDKMAIGLPLEEMLEDAKVAFDVFRSDIFGLTQYHAGADPVMRVKDICDRVRKEVVGHVNGEDYSWEDLDRIVLILDTDGSFVPDDLVVENDREEHIRYFTDHIEAPIAQQVRERNVGRSHNIRKMIDKGHVTYRKIAVPVDVYFFSRNLEHAIHNRSGHLTDRVKARLANEFRSAYRINPSCFVRLLEEVLAVPGDYRGTWDYIYKDAHSLERSSNLHLLLRHMASDRS